MFTITHKGDLKKTTKFLQDASKLDIRHMLEKYGEKGVQELSRATPKDSGNTASSWSYVIESNGNNYSIYWVNSNVNKGVNIAIILQYGHGTGWGGYVQGRDYINPVTLSLYEEILDEIGKEVNKL